MHEMAITQSILDIVLSAGKDAGAQHVRAIRLKTGAYSDVVPSLVQECFDLLARGSIAEHAVLHFEALPLIVRCRGCGWQGEIEKRHIACKACGGQDLEMLSGREFYVDSIEAE
ncbi:MAG: hydrogenase maturation nickel metallochaperone HypA [Faecalibacterium sp.]|jgi:hydrogenase nickel incorporation protein HypA/HybF|nr:hydrogenase maturation nickel metallochaperone HypA [Faecalibacterium sp.]